MQRIFRNEKPIRFPNTRSSTDKRFVGTSLLPVYMMRYNGHPEYVND